MKVNKIIIRGLSIIELIVVVTIIIIMAGGGMVYLGRFRSDQQVEAVAQELTTKLRLARNYAVTGQMPDSGELNYVEVSINGGVIEAVVNGVGSSYYSHSISAEEVEANLTDDLRFAVYDGKLVRADGQPLGVNETVQVIVSFAAVGTTRTIEVASSGLIND